MKTGTNSTTEIIHRRRLLLQWHITERCNLRCSHCYQDRYSGPEMSLPQLLQVLEQFRALLAEVGPAPDKPARGHITVTGGDPFVREDCLEFLAHIAAFQPAMRFSILTNGSRLDERMVKRLRPLRPSFVQVSIDGLPSTHDRIRGRGDYVRTVSAIRRLVAAGITTYISFTAHRKNYREFPAVADMGLALGVARVWADRMLPAGGAAGCGEHVLTAAETREFFGIMAAAAARHRRHAHGVSPVAMHRALQFLEGGTPYHCTAGDTLITLMPNGDVYPCRRMPIYAANVLDTPLNELYFQSPLFRRLRDRNRVSDGCGGCSYESACRGGLKCLSYAMTGDPFTADPGCWIAGRREPQTPCPPAIPSSTGRLVQISI